MIWHRIENSVVVETTDIDPAGRFHPSLVWVVDGSAEAEVGWNWDDGTFTPPSVPEPTPVTADTLKWVVTKKRWQVETGGITLPSGVQVATGIDDQNRITSVISNASLSGLETVSFKATSGWATLTISELEGIAAAIALHVQQCFSAERTHHETIDELAALHADNASAMRVLFENYDTNEGWPTSSFHAP